jgi:outer membrane protein assembly factor BamB
MFNLNAFSGEKRWEAPLDGGALTSPIVSSDKVALVPIRTGGRHELVAIDAVSGRPLWRKDCAEWSLQCALMALENTFVINFAGGIVRALDARSGEERWTTVLGPTCSDDVPFNLRVMLRGGMLFVPADTVYVVHPEDGRVIHTLGGEPPVPDLLHVDPSLAVFIGEDSGHIGMYDLTSRLSIVS